MICYPVHMSTEKKNAISDKSEYLNRFAQLAKVGGFVFHAGDLANLWQIQNSNTLYTTLKRYTKKGLLFRVYKGLYSLKPAGELDPLLLGLKALHTYAYVSAETVLVRAGIIQQKIDFFTLISSRSRRFSVAGNNYYARKLKDSFLYQPAGIVEEGGVKKATVERAVADLLYFNPKAHLDGAASKMIDWKKVKKIQKEIGYDFA